ncbi:SRPBCC domain-containing protein [Fodinibius sp. Rm-B-1B1-1]|uniref:SRPBCC domain-containing protein n=1 Tax=Fodinibius alkaliphilus TaxID=3140241 RepID=UPI00315AB9E0
MNNKTNFKIKERELIATRVFNTPRELIFEAHSSCKQLKNWWGPRSWPMEECTMDFRESGTWHYCLRGPNAGDESWGKVIYKKIVRPERIEYEDYFSDKEGNINSEMPGMQITVEFIDQGDATKLVSRTLFDSSDALQSVVDMGVKEGFAETWDRLEEHLAKLAIKD